MPIKVNLPGGGVANFPDGTPPEVIERELATVTGQPQASHDAPKPGIVERATNWLPAIGGMVGGVAGGVPGAAVGGAAGEGLRKLAQSAGQLPAAVADIARNMATPEGRSATAQGFASGAREGAIDSGLEGAGQAGAQVVGGVVGKGVGMAGRALADTAAGRLVQAAVKPAVSSLRQQAGASVEGLTGTTKKMADILLKNRWKHADSARDALAAAEQRIQHGVTPDPNASFQPLLDTATRIPKYLGELADDAGKQAIPGADVAAIESTMDGVLEGNLAQSVKRPATTGFIPGREVPTTQVQRVMRAGVTPEQGLEAARKSSKWANSKAYGELKGAETEASKTVERAIRHSLKDAAAHPQAPARLKAVPAAMSEQSDALTVLPLLDRMTWRQGNRDLLGFPAIAATGAEVAAGKVPIVGILAQLARSGQLRAGYGAHSLGNVLKAAASHQATVPALGGALSPAAQALIDSMRSRDRSTK